METIWHFITLDCFHAFGFCVSIIFHHLVPIRSARRAMVITLHRLATGGNGCSENRESFGKIPETVCAALECGESV